MDVPAKGAMEADTLTENVGHVEELEKCIIHTKLLNEANTELLYKLLSTLKENGGSPHPSVSFFQLCVAVFLLRPQSIITKLVKCFSEYGIKLTIMEL